MCVGGCVCRGVCVCVGGVCVYGGCVCMGVCVCRGCVCGGCAVCVGVYVCRVCVRVRSARAHLRLCTQLCLTLLTVLQVPLSIEFTF